MEKRPPNLENTSNSPLFDIENFANSAERILTSTKKTKILSKAHELGLYDLEWSKKDFNEAYFKLRPDDLKHCSNETQIKALCDISIHLLSAQISNQSKGSKTRNHLIKQRNRVIASHPDALSKAESFNDSIRRQSPLKISERKRVIPRHKPFLAQAAKVLRIAKEPIHLQMFRSTSLTMLAKFSDSLKRFTKSESQLKAILEKRVENDPENMNRKSIDFEEHIRIEFGEDHEPEEQIRIVFDDEEDFIIEKIRILPESDQVETESQEDFIYIEEFDPSKDNIERVDLVEKMFDRIPNVNTPEEKRAYLIKHNRNVALDNFISKERFRLSRKGSQEWKDARRWDTKWLSATEMTEIANRYSIPMVWTMRGNHAQVLTRPPEKIGHNRYQVFVYNPFYEGEQSYELNTNRRDSDPMLYHTDTIPGQNPGGSAYDGDHYDQLIESLKQADYNLQIPAIPGKEWLTRAKRGALQEGEGYNCTLWTIFYAAIANAMQPGFNTFKFAGHEKWIEDTGYYLFKFEDVNN
ncbi:hypothetical protein ACFL1M_03600 [Patescibacteria group bacterium]